MKKLVSVISAGLLVFALFGCSKKVEKGEFTVQKGKFLVAMEIGYPPMEYYAEDGKTPTGFDIELSKEIAKYCLFCKYSCIHVSYFPINLLLLVL